MICLLPTSPRKIRNGRSAVTPRPLLNPTTMKGSGESMGKANSVKLSLEEQATKVCTKCGEEKGLDAFNVSRRNKCGRRSECRVCQTVINRKYNEEDREEKRKRATERQRKWRKENPERDFENDRKWRQQNREKCAAKSRLYRKNNKKKVADSKNKRARIKYKNNTVYKLTCSLRSRLSIAIARKCKTGSAVRDLGCTGEEARNHIQTLFDGNMTWENYGTYWHLDHIFPLSAANLEDRAEFLAVNNWRNLQPLEAKANFAKKDKVTPSARRLFNKLVKEFS